ncbi:MAG: protease modulator HflC [Clostridiales bacterium]|nr:protease modulator HflC [Clostridiales bacterium]
MNSGKPINYASAAFTAGLKRNRGKLILFGILLIVVIVLLNESLFIVGEAEQSVVTRFGVIKQIVINRNNDFHERYADLLKDEISLDGSIQIVEGSGLHFKVPFMDKVETYSSRLYTYISDSEVVNTAEKKQYYVQTYAQWYIADPALFSLKLGSMTSAENQLDNLIHPVIVQVINRMSAEDFVSNKDALNAALAKGLKTVNEDMAPRGIEIKDIQVHRTILPSANIESTYARMQADRAKVAQQLRSEGEESYRKAVSSTDLEARQIEADAISEAGAVRAQAETESMKIYAEAYGVDPDFYSYWRSLQALREALTSKATLVLDKNHPLWSELLAYAISPENVQ